MTAKNRKEVHLLFLTNSQGELTNHKEVGDQHLEWYTDEVYDTDWLMFLAELDGEVGVLATWEIQHPESEEWAHMKPYLTPEELQATPQQVWNEASELAERLDKSVSFDMYLGYKTGFVECHEICMWIPFGTSEEAMKRAFEQKDEIFAR